MDNMNTQILLGLFAVLALMVIFLIIIVSVKTHKKIAYQKALIKTRQLELAAKKIAKEKSDAAKDSKSDPDKETKSGAGRGFKPSI